MTDDLDEHIAVVGIADRLPDVGFFGFTQRDAAALDPQIRLFLELAHSAVEDAGYDPARMAGVGVFGCAGMNRCLDLHVRPGEGYAPRPPESWRSAR